MHEWVGGNLLILFVTATPPPRGQPQAWSQTATKAAAPAAECVMWVASGGFPAPGGAAPVDAPPPHDDGVATHDTCVRRARGKGGRGQPSVALSWTEVGVSATKNPDDTPVRHRGFCGQPLHWPSSPAPPTLGSHHLLLPAAAAPLRRSPRTCLALAMPMRREPVVDTHRSCISGAGRLVLGRRMGRHEKPRLGWVMKMVG